MHQFSLDCTTLLLLSAFAQIPNREKTLDYDNKQILFVAAEHLLYVFLSYNTTQLKDFKYALNSTPHLTKKLMQAIGMENQFNQ